MFDSLDEQMKHDSHGEKTRKEWVLEVLAVAVLSIVIFAGLFLGVRLLQ